MARPVSVKATAWTLSHTVVMEGAREEFHTYSSRVYERTGELSRVGNAPASRERLETSDTPRGF